MVTRIELTPRDTDIVGILARRVRLLSIDQLARTFWKEVARPVDAANRRVAALTKEGLLERLTVLAHPEIDLPAPVAVWKRGEAAPDFDALAYRLRKRWNLPPRSTPVVIASAGAGEWLGGRGGRRPRRSEATHDLHLTAVYLKMRAEQPKRAARWISEAIIQAEGGGRDEKLPDAIIRNRAGATAIEMGGLYTAKKLAAFHDDCARRGMAYEIW
ncbi:MAG: hypothetical protein HOP29_11390 [Phycisphaerales bacterium]|nr:hypothetical protein [Phycisphaerales bacterium]